MADEMTTSAEHTDEHTDESTYDSTHEHTDDELFKEAGGCSDDVILTFDDRRHLYVSENFLCYASPVFKAMFSHGFKEQETREILMKEKSFEDVHEFLLCLHPAVQKPIDTGNALRMVALADEYHVKPTLNKCKETMKKWMMFALKYANGPRKHEFKEPINYYAPASTCLKILKKAEELSYEEIIDYAIKTLGKFGYNIFTGSKTVASPRCTSGFSFGSTPPRTTIQAQATTGFGLANTPSTCGLTLAHISGNDDDDDVWGSPEAYGGHVSSKDCCTLFNNLSDHTKCRLSLERLRVCDDGSIRE